MATPNPPNLWILASNRHGRYLERVWCRNPTALNRSRLTRQIHLCNKQMSKAKSAHYSKIVAERFGDQRSFWKAFNKILHRCPKIHLPDHSSIDALENKFSSFFINKISIMRAAFSDSYSYVLNPPHSKRVLKNLTCVTEDEVRHLIPLAPCKSADLDPILTGLVKDCIDILVTPITSIVNLSLSEGSFSSHFKSVLDCPCLPSIENSTLDKDSLKNYRPSFLSKVLEKALAIRLNSHIIINS